MEPLRCARLICTAFRLNSLTVEELTQSETLSLDKVSGKGKEM